MHDGVKWNQQRHYPKVTSERLELNSLKEAQNSASRAIQHLSNELRAEMTEIKSKISAIKSKKKKNTEKLNTLQDFCIPILEKEARRKNLVIYGLQESKANISFEEELAHYLARMVPQSSIQAHDLQDVFKLPSKSETRPILIRFSNADQGDVVLRNGRVLDRTSVCDSGLFT
ncbi:hypothetical protein QYM36_007834 [Artemia franciscana]|uniref:Uncharacterized protein n=1 Tax=Artemia franciscana TaxID=6661 RepID=A0AA88LD81_ARTSF|nr:hypothetical protein QYM36_007834 [Artemia franciscana]